MSLSIELTNLDRILYLAGQNLPRTTIDHLRQQAEELYQIDEVFLEDIESLLASVWEDYTDEEINQILIEAFETFDIDRQGTLFTTRFNEHLEPIWRYAINQ